MQLTDEQIATITSDNDIKVHIIGVDYSDENIFTIDIKDSNGLPSKLYANDLENKFIGTVDTMEWKYSAEDEWTAFGIKEPVSYTHLVEQQSLQFALIGVDVFQ